MMRMIAAVRPLKPDFAFFTGWDAALMPMLLIGCDGGTNATSGVVPEITRKLYDLTLAHRIDEARAMKPIEERSLPFGKTVMMFDGVPLDRLAALGETRIPGLADLFVATMKGTYA